MDIMLFVLVPEFFSVGIMRSDLAPEVLACKVPWNMSSIQR